jgi:hypothetical protein
VELWSRSVRFISHCFTVAQADTHPTLIFRVALQVCCQWTGVNVNSYYGPTIYKQLGYSGPTVLLISGISGAWGMVVTYVFFCRSCLESKRRVADLFRSSFSLASSSLRSWLIGSAGVVPSSMVEWPWLSGS